MWGYTRLLHTEHIFRSILHNLWWWLHSSECPSWFRVDWCNLLLNLHLNMFGDYASSFLRMEWLFGVDD